MAAVEWAVTRVEERVVELKEVVRSLRPCHGGWVAMTMKGGGVRVEATVGWEAEHSSNNNNVSPPPPTTPRTRATIMMSPLPP